MASGSTYNRSVRLGAALMATQALFSAGESVATHWLRDLPALSLVTARNLGGVVLAVALARGVPWRSQVPRLQIWRCSLSLLSLWAYVSAFQLLPIADATAIYYLTPLLWTLWSWALLGEQTTRLQSLLAALGIAAALLIAKPGFGGDGWIYLAAFAGVLLNATLLPLSRQIGQHDAAPTMLFWIGLSGAIASLLIGWGNPLPPLSLPLLAVALCGSTAQLCGLVAVRHGSLGALASFGYVKLPIMIGVGCMLFSEFPDALSLLGGALIIASCWLSMPARQVQQEAASCKAI
jgi:drug/metabolite transporter (DMT)-like permease